MPIKIESLVVATVPPTTTDDETLGYRRGTRWEVSTTKLVYTLVDDTAGAAVWELPYRVLDYTFNPTITGSTTYERASVFCFQGTDVLGTPIGIYIVAGWIDNTTQSVRVYDVTNNQVICERTDITDEFPSHQHMEPLSNLSEGHAMWEIQQKRPAGGPSKEVAVASVQLEF